MPGIYPHSVNEADRAEEMIPSMAYATLLQNLERLTELGVIAPENTVSMLVVARLVDRARIVRSGINAQAIERTLDAYRLRRNPVHAVVKALERAVEIARENEPA
jgi:hypothetical protein